MSFEWKNALVDAESLVLDTLNVIDRASNRAAFVVDKDQRLVGMVTDGDIRRGLLKNISLQDPVTKVMNSNPLTCSINDSKQAILRLMDAKDILHMPIVSDGDRLVKVLSKQDLEDRPYFESPVFLMAGGRGTRLQPLTDHCPKPLLKVGKKPILETILEGFIESGFRKFFISTHYRSDMVRQHFGDGSQWQVSIDYTEESEPLGTGGALGLLPSDLPDHPLIMMNGDILTNVNFPALLDYHIEAGADATVCVRQQQYQIPYGVIQSNDFKIQHIDEKPINRFYINAGIYVINPSIVKQVKQGEYLDMPNLLNQQIHSGANVMMYPLDEYWLDVGRMNDFHQAQQDLGTRLQ